MAAWVFGRLGKRVGQPLAVGEMAAGLLLGPSALGLIWPDSWPALFPLHTQQSLQLLAKLGLVLLLFQVGMEFDYTHLQSRSKTVIAVSGMGIAIPMAGGLIIGPWVHETFAPDTNRFGFQLFLCIALSISALPIMGRILLELGLERTAMGALAISAAAIDDVIGWILLAVATAVVTSGFDWGNLFLQVAGVGCFAMIQIRWVGPWMGRLWNRFRETTGLELHPSYLALLLVVLFTSCLISNLLGVFSIFGAFLFGVGLHRERGLVEAWRKRFSEFVLVALVPVFFTNTGLRTEIGSLHGWLGVWGAVVILLTAVVGKLGGCWVAALWTGESFRQSGCIAALMNTRALMGLVAVNIGMDLGLLTKELFTMLVVMALLTTVMTGPLLRHLWNPEH